MNREELYDDIVSFLNNQGILTIQSSTLEMIADYTEYKNKRNKK